MAQRDERRHDERDRLRQACTDELSDLREADDNETSDVMLDVAAKTAARTARHLSKPDSDAPPRAWHQKPASKAGAILTLIGLLAAAIKALQDAGLLD